MKFLAWLTSIQNPFLDALVGLLDFMGEETFYLLIVPIIYWSISKKIGYQLSTIMMVSLYVNSFLKFFVPVKRPIGVEGIHSIRVETVQDSALYPYDSFTSGHAQGSFTLWSYFAYVVRKPAFTVFAIIIAFFISFSRLYAGLHWPTDVISGAVVGLFITFVGIWLTPFISKLTLPLQWSLAIVVPIILFFITPSTEAVKTSGFILGSSIAYLLETQYVRMNVKSSLWKKVVAYVLGLAGAVIIKSLLKSLFPEALLFDFIRYAAMGLWIFLIAPWIFVQLKLYPSDRAFIITHKGIPK